MEITKDNICAYLDHTDVKADATEADIKKLCEEAERYAFHSVCVTPYRVKAAREALGSAQTEIICVIGFPFGFTTTQVKINEAKIAVEDGATEIDMVMNIGAAKEGDWDYAKEEIRQIAEAIQPIELKVILEVGFLTEEEIRRACEAARDAGAKFVKTSTGYGPRATNLRDIKIMKETVGEACKIKAAGGISDFETAKKMIEAGADRIGTSHALKIIGAGDEEKKDKAGSSE